MKTKEFFRKIEALGFKVDDCNGDLLIGDTNRNYCHSSSGERYKREIYHDHLEKLEEETRHKLLDLVVEYAKTPVEEREESKKYYLKLPEMFDSDLGYVNYEKDDNCYFFSDMFTTDLFQTQFTQEEIDNMPDQEFIQSLIKEEVQWIWL